ncbi:MAG: LON peptidase substrate-binding domain-containing protein [Actinomycetia bacterium]|nr:LON peptidase substrate-binding domain-containing protein [Actinomycetes bacterium]MCH9801831.1 LON peptidase substrate-binding domain-containing protein [Actinomycetes bacterium]
MSVVPMFPLGSALLPHAPLPLRIFEARYLQMLGQLLESEQPEFGVVLIERGSEVGGGDQRFEVGTMARIIACEALADCMVIVGLGTRRIRIQEWLPDDPYPRAEVTDLDALTWDEADRLALQEVEQEVRAAAQLAAAESGDDIPADFEFSEDPVTAAWQLAALAPLGDLDRVKLLQVATTSELLEQTKAGTEDAVQLMRLLGGDPDSID